MKTSRQAVYLSPALRIVALLLLTVGALPVRAETIPNGEVTANAQERYRLFEHERAVCEHFTQLVSQDEEWMRRFLTLDVRQSEGISRMLQKSQYRETAVFQYILTHLDRFYIDVDWHGSHLAQAGPIFCEIGPTRLQELEALGPSQLSWQARKLVLEQCFEDLNWPWDEAAYGKDFEVCLAELNQAKQIYRETPWDKELRQYVDQQVKRLTKTDEELQATEGYAGRTAQQHKETLSLWIQELLG